VGERVKSSPIGPRGELDWNPGKWGGNSGSAFSQREGDWKRGKKRRWGGGHAFLARLERTEPSIERSNHSEDQNGRGLSIVSVPAKARESRAAKISQEKRGEGYSNFAGRGDRAGTTWKSYRR